MGWTATFQIPLLLSLSFHAGILLLNSFTQNKNYVSNTIIALVLVLFCLCIYQPAATAFLIPITIFTISKKKLLVKHCFYLVAFLFTSLIVYYIIFQLSLKWYNVMPADRTALSLFKIPYKLILFYLRELRMLMYGSGILVLKKLTLIIGIISFLGFFYLLIVKKQHRYKNLKFFLFFSLVLAFSYTPNILSSSYYVCSRVIAPAAIIVLFYQFYFFRHLILKKKLNKKIGVFIALLFIILSSINQNIFISKIQQTEFLAIKESVNQISLENKKDIVIIKPKDSFLIKNKFYKNNYADEFGQVSSSRIWVAKPMFQQLLAERKNETPLKLNYKISTINEEINKPVKDSIIIDLRYVLKNAFK
ncbi:glucosyltransferase domain-containing protein [Neotamlana laminarinivorans]|uniref:Glucosyltransferase domain-containing protein n=1 Tax=Neotamlana laminarinivorans TaxID=2883124 RepID=A0A9X1L4D1_9FLAO|nr:glucosyltransferase domain-containing protein [Tamlana laminarinivorans]MCB4799182.1 glucosyltransferase domain-containing protein [Tamlana laminarinivorans]